MRKRSKLAGEQILMILYIKMQVLDDPQACITENKVCDAEDNCGDLSDEDFSPGDDSLCNGFRLYDFEDGDMGLFQGDVNFPLKWTCDQPDRTNQRIKAPLFDHSAFDSEYHYLHVSY